MDVFKLYYLQDQRDQIDGTKIFIADFSNLNSALDRAASDAIVHYSVENVQPETGTTDIVFIC